MKKESVSENNAIIKVCIIGGGSNTDYLMSLLEKMTNSDINVVEVTEREPADFIIQITEDPVPLGNTLPLLLIEPFFHMKKGLSPIRPPPK